MFPPFPTEEARKYCEEILTALECGDLELVQVSAPSQERDGHGVMLGVLVCKDTDGHKIILKAVSGNSLVPNVTHKNSQPQIVLQASDDSSTNSISEMWVPPIVDSSVIMETLFPNDKKIHELTDELKLATTDSERRKISEERSALTTESLAKVHALYKFHTASGRVLSLREICKVKLPPTGTGDCCAPKLFDYAFSHGLAPISMDEVFYQRQQTESELLQTASVQTVAPLQNSQKIYGHSYAPCDERCGIVLPAMLELEIIYRDDDIIVVNKPSGVLSVPGIGAEKQDCIASRVRRLFPHCIAQPTVHRLDMETSGLMVLAFNADAHRNLSIQFQNSQVQKKYTALLDGSLAEATGECAPPPDQTHGIMTLYFILDVDNRPNQIWDAVHGKKSITEWERLGFEWYAPPADRIANQKNDAAAKIVNRKVTRVLFTPHTGRTHQLRLASADSHGFGIPIVGDSLYNKRYSHLYEGKGALTPEQSLLRPERLCLHANYLSFTHPTTNERMEFTSKVPF